MRKGQGASKAPLRARGWTARWNPTLLIQAVMNRDELSVERVSNNRLQLMLSLPAAPAVAGLGTRLATGRDWPEAQVFEKKGLKELAERVGFEPTCRNYPTIRFRVGAVMTTSVPLRLT
jgi:hypothetical protein